MASADYCNGLHVDRCVCEETQTTGRCIENCVQVADGVSSGAQVNIEGYLNSVDCGYVQIDFSEPGDSVGGGNCGAVIYRKECTSDGGGGDTGGDEGTDTGTTTYPITFKGNVYCQEGTTKYPMTGVEIFINNDDPAALERKSIKTTTGTDGKYSVLFDNIRWGGHFDVVISNIDETKTLSNGTSYSVLTLANTYCDYDENVNNLKCLNVEETNPDYEKGFLVCTVSSSSYEKADKLTDLGYEFYDHCRLPRADNDIWNGNPTANNFDFIFSNCSGTVEPNESCGDGICQAGETCENPETLSGIICPSGEALDVECRADCTYCGDGIVNGTEECDHGGTPTPGCDINCEMVTAEDTNTCVALDRAATDPVGPNEIELFDVEVNTTGTTQPYTLANVKLRVTLTSDDIPVGEDVYNPGEGIVTAFAVAQVSETNWQYHFAWQASSLANGSYEVEVSFDGGTTWETIPACIYDFTYDSGEEVEPAFLIVKTGTSVCSTAGGATLSYTLTVTNLGPGTGIITNVTDEIDDGIQDSWVTGITSSSGMTGSISNGIITWTGTETQRTFSENESQTFSYTVTIPNANLATLAEGVENVATVTYDSDQVRYNFYLDDLCGTTGVLPSTGIVDETPWILGIAAVLIGMIALRLGGGKEFIYPALRKTRFLVFTTLGLGSIEADVRREEIEERYR
ncbi:hypothetical protein JW978_00800 [Candidatus Dojkabacteria bacterium]|nr:hypothetical protein [Candidatus Dojkabacteria bacterium]